MTCVSALLMMLWTAQTQAFAQQFSITASVDRQTVPLNEQVVLTVAVSGDQPSLPDPRLPSMPNFNVHSVGRSQNLSFINNRVSSTVEHRFILVPRLIGNAVIGPIEAQSGGKKVSTDPIEISVLRPSAAASPQPTRPTAARPRPRQAPQPSGSQTGSGPDIFVTAEVNKRNPYVNEQMLMTVRFHYAVPLLGNAEWDPPVTQGFLKEDLPPAPATLVTREGRVYYVTEIKIVLFPIQPGELTIGPTQIRCQVQKEMRVDPFSSDFFEQFFSQGVVGAVTRELRTNPTRITAQPLPEEGKPQSFTGAVGRFRIKADVDKGQANVGDAITLSLVLEGDGNLKSLSAVPLPEMPSFRPYDTVSTLSTSKDVQGVRGVKTFKTVLVPRASGLLEIPPIQFNYFDPTTKRYERIQTNILRVKVAPAQTGAGGTSPVAFQAGPIAGGGEITRVAADIRYLKIAADDPLAQRLCLGSFSRLWLHLIPLTVFLLSLAGAAYRNVLLNDPAGARSKGALAKAMSRIKDVRGAGSPEETAAGLFEALSNFVADKLNQPASGLTLREAGRSLREKYPKLPEGHLGQLRILWEELEMFRFAPKGAQEEQTAHLADGVKELLKALDEELHA
ncbi:MAG: BatD family protein [Elusimicrobiota bacterium]